MQTCECGAPMLVGICVICGGTTKRNEKVNSTRMKKKSDAKSPSVDSIRILKIPNFVNKDGTKSLPNYFGYSTAKGKKGSMETRRAKLSELINTDLLPSEENREYIESFGPMGSEKRIRAIIELFRIHVGAQYYVDEKHKLWESKQKKEADIEWLLSQLT